jgi:polyketide cyclase/dehydrase/lipid transport protein
MARVKTPESPVDPPQTADGPMGRIKSEVGGLAGALADRAVSAARDTVEGAVGRLTDYAEGSGGPGLVSALTGAKNLAEGKSPTRSLFGAGMAGLKEKVTGMFGGGGKGGGGGKKKLKMTNIVESVDVGVPIEVAYNQWTQFADFPTFMKKVENVEQAEDQKLNWKAQVFWSHRTWEATIVEQQPEDKIVWRSKGAKGHVDGAVTFHELAPSLTKIIVVLEYHPQGLFERTGNIWRAQGRRARLELKHFQRHIMTQTILNPEEVEGWRGVIEDREVVKDHETAMDEERSAADGEAPADELDEAPDDELDEPDSELDEEPDDELSEEPDGARGEEEDEEPVNERAGRSRTRRKVRA